jgi:hypothetical protein
MWRQHRIGKLEAAILYWQNLKLQVGIVCWHPTESLEGILGWPQRANALHKPGEEMKKLAKQAGTQDLAAAGEAHVRGQESLAKLSRYESALNRNLLRLLHELQRPQAARKGEHVPPPQVVDVDVTGLPETSRADDQLPQGD